MKKLTSIPTVSEIPPLLRCRGLAVAGLLGLAVGASGPLAPAGPEVSTRADTALHALEWLAGRWIGEENGVRMEEIWTDPAGNVILGLHRDVSPSGDAFFEFLRIEARPEGVYYVASPRGGKPTEFRMVDQRPRRAVFENPEHDFPQRIIYEAPEPDRLHARIEGEVGGEPRSRQWLWRRATLASGAETGPGQ